MIKMLNFFLKDKTNLELISNIVVNNKITNSVDTNPHKDSLFYIGKLHILKISNNDEACAIYMHNDLVPLFILDNKDEVHTLRQLIIKEFAVVAVSLIN